MSQELRDDYNAGGEKRESLELALLETIRGVGSDAKHETIRVTSLQESIHVHIAGA